METAPSLMGEYGAVILSSIAYVLVHFRSLKSRSRSFAAGYGFFSQRGWNVVRLYRRLHRAGAGVQACRCCAALLLCGCLRVLSVAPRRAGASKGFITAVAAWARSFADDDYLLYRSVIATKAVHTSLSSNGSDRCPPAPYKSCFQIHDAGKLGRWHPLRPDGSVPLGVWGVFRAVYSWSRPCVM